VVGPAFTGVTAKYHPVTVAIAGDPAFALFRCDGRVGFAQKSAVRIYLFFGTADYGHRNEHNKGDETN
jgi:hypothetical protein